MSFSHFLSKQFNKLNKVVIDSYPDKSIGHVLTLSPHHKTFRVIVLDNCTSNNLKIILQVFYSQIGVQAKVKAFPEGMSEGVLQSS